MFYIKSFLSQDQVYNKLLSYSDTVHQHILHALISSKNIKNILLLYSQHQPIQCSNDLIRSSATININWKYIKISFYQSLLSYLKSDIISVWTKYIEVGHKNDLDKKSWQHCQVCDFSSLIVCSVARNSKEGLATLLLIMQESRSIPE